MGYTVTGFSDVFRISAYFGCLLLDFVPIAVAEGYNAAHCVHYTILNIIVSSRNLAKPTFEFRINDYYSQATSYRNTPFL